LKGFQEMWFFGDDELQQAPVWRDYRLVVYHHPLMGDNKEVSNLFTLFFFFGFWLIDVSG
jgi:hypothetical protein